MNQMTAGAALWAGLGLGASLACLPAQAQALPDAGSELQRQEQQRQQLRQRNEAMPDVRLQAPLAPLPQRLPAETPCRPIQVVRFAAADDGSPVLPASFIGALQTALSGPLRDDAPQGRCLGAQGIELLLDRANNALIAQGLITSRVQALPQSLADGALVLSLQPGLVGQVQGAAPRTALATATGEVLSLRDVEQTLENLRRNPSVEADIEIRPAQAEGHSDLQIHRQQGRPWRVDLALDDAGSRGTGRWQGHATLSWDDPLGLSDLAYASVGRDLAGRDPGPRGSRNVLLHYSVPMGYWLLGATVSSNHYHQQVMGAYQAYRYSGSSHQAELQLSRVLHRDANSKTTASVEAFSRRASNAIDDTEVIVQRRRTAGWEAGLQHLHYLGAATVDASLLYRRGTGAFGALPAPEEAFGEGSSRMQLTQLGIGLHTPLALGGWAPPLRYSGQLRAQWNHTPLTPQDRLCLGNRYTVRGFDGEQTVCGERGWLVRHEVSAPWGLADLPGVLQAYAALDVGRLQGPSAHAFPGAAVLAGTALGLRWAGSAQGAALQVEAFIGQPLRKPPGFETARTTAGISVNASF